jgi:type IV secretory pathway TrbD component
MLRRGAFRPAETVITWTIAVVLFVVGAVGLAVGLQAHRWLLAGAGLGVWCIGGMYARAARLGHPL